MEVAQVKGACHEVQSRWISFPCCVRMEEQERHSREKAPDQHLLAILGNCVRRPPGMAVHHHHINLLVGGPHRWRYSGDGSVRLQAHRLQLEIPSPFFRPHRVVAESDDI